MRLDNRNILKSFGATLALAVLLLPAAGSANPGSTDVQPPGCVDPLCTYTYTQRINNGSGLPYYPYYDPSSQNPTGANGGGLGIYSWYDQDFGWRHDFPAYNTTDINITSVKMTIEAWDVDSEPYHGTEGEYDGLKVDGVDLDPGLLQGTNGTWSFTEFDVPISNVTDDGLINVFLDIDMNHNRQYWATNIKESLLTVVYTIENPPNVPPQVSVTLAPSPTAPESADLVATAVATDPEDDAASIPVTVIYRWYVDVGQGFYVDDEFAGRNDHTGATVPAADTQPGDRWKVEVIAKDSKGAVSDKDTAATEIGFANAYPSTTTYNTLVFEDRWPLLGDYDVNDMVIWYRVKTDANSSGEVLAVTFEGELVARGGGYGNSFGLSFADFEAVDVDSSTLTIGGSNVPIAPEAGHSGELVYILIDDARTYMPGDGAFNFFNTEEGDRRATIPISFTFTLTTAKSGSTLNGKFFNPFIVADIGSKGRDAEVHLRDYPPTDLADQSLFGTGDDASVPAKGIYYRSAKNMPWALDISGQWYHPLESVDIVKAYPEMEKWIESGGSQNKDWYLHPETKLVWPGPK